MRILVVSGLPWNTNNSFGSTFSSFFEGMENVEFLNIYCGYGLPQNNVKSSYIQMTELSLLKNLLSPNRNKTFRFFSGENENETNVERATQSEKGKIDRLRRYNSRLVFWARCFIWKIGRWRNHEIEKIIKDFNPNIIFSPLYYNPYLNSLTLYTAKLVGAPIGIFVSDDIYSLHQFSLSPFFWGERLLIRPNIKKTVLASKLCYTISEEQKAEYESIFHKRFDILTKGDDFDTNIEISLPQKPIKIVFTGAVYGGRFDSLKLLMKAIERFNDGERKVELYIYSGSSLNSKEKKALSKYEYTHWMGSVSGDEVRQVQRESDVLLHVESLKLSERRKVRHSFSTKLVEYFKSGKCILAIGRKDCTSITYLEKHCCGYVAENSAEITEFLDLAYSDPTAMEKYVAGAIECGRKNHSRILIQQGLEKQLKLIAGTEI